MGAIPVDKDGKLLEEPSYGPIEKRRTVGKARRSGNDFVYRLTGSRITPTYSGPKIAWIKDNELEIYNKAHKFLNEGLHRLQIHRRVRDQHSDASMTLLFDIENRSGRKIPLRFSDLIWRNFPAVTSSTNVVSKIFPKVAEELGLSKKTLLVRGGGDGAQLAWEQGLSVQTRLISISVRRAGSAHAPRNLSSTRSRGHLTSHIPLRVSLPNWNNAGRGSFVSLG